MRDIPDTLNRFRELCENADCMTMARESIGADSRVGNWRNCRIARDHDASDKMPHWLARIFRNLE